MVLHIVHMGNPVCGFIARSVCKSTNCESCQILLKAEEDVIDIQVTFSNMAQLSENDDLLKTMFLEQINSGRLVKLSHLIFNLGLHMWNFYTALTHNKDLQKASIDSENSREVFVEAFVIWSKNQADVSKLIKLKCYKDHSFEHLVQQSAGKMFNCFSKNKSADTNSDIYTKK